MSTTAVQRLLLLVGAPGSGKSTFSKALTRVYPEYVRISQDDLGDRHACEAIAMSALQVKDRTQSVVIDRCNFDQKQRKTWVKLAKQLNVEEIDVIIMDTEFHQCKKRILNRTNHPTRVDGAHGVEILYKFLGMLTLPTYFEGFSKIMKLAPQPTPDYSDETVREILQRLDMVEKPENLQVPRWQKEDYYFKTQRHHNEKAAQQNRGSHSNKGLRVDNEDFTVMRHPEQKWESSAAHSPRFGATPLTGWRAREAAKRQKQEQEQAVANPVDILDESNGDME
ncbi:hypothetical protein BGZ65_001486 [Modicella reniformis]|uniref:Uncharacterized protein n=1 Tax=Modicella reniformis TaxID=1440133 RepID=A0A9P6J6R6_9FUNG|nr:hypothetical protein BGZ65_001486 [Modicella reniformis]